MKKLVLVLSFISSSLIAQENTVDSQYSFGVGIGATYSGLGANVALTKVNAPFEPDIQSDQQFIEQIKSAFVKETFSIDTTISNSVTEGILTTAAERGVNLIVLAAHHRNFLTQLIDPSKSKQVIIRSDIPVLTYQL